MPRNNWERLLASIDRYNKLRGMLQDYDSHVEDIIRPKGMRRAQYRSLLSRLRQAEIDIEEQATICFQPKG